MRAASGCGFLSMLVASQDSMPGLVHGEGLLAWPVSFLVICLGLLVILAGLEGPAKTKIASSSVVLVWAGLALYRVVWFSPFGDDDLNAIWNYSLVPSGAGLLAYFMVRVFEKWLVFIKSKNQGVV